ncbi:MAG: CHAT domain-containing protein [Deltaproteobacteria bacterium]|nr:CHAT domain-containing protein [Deltaproteobacteria bacterium]
MHIKTLRLEIVRQGPSHNQLLSPLTPYLALCGNNDAEVVHFGAEHAQFGRRLEALTQMTHGALDDVSEDVSRFLAGIRSLGSSLTALSQGNTGNALVHLRCIISPAELAAVPFELALAPPGFPAAGQRLSLQGVVPLALTREVRRVPASVVRWPDEPRILFAAATHGQLPPVPIRAHVAALLKAFKPWVESNEPKTLERHISNEPKTLERHITVIDRASLSSIHRACSRERYTHVHILAHGAPLERPSGQQKFGLALHDDREGVDVVDGSRLASAVRARATGDDFELPAVMTIASCDSGNAGSVLTPDASIAHQLHEAGVPFVIASQFPLSVIGSVVMTELVYSELLAGSDPRVLVHALRQKLHVECRKTNDWASVVAYAALPKDIDAQVLSARLTRTRRRVRVAIRRNETASGPTKEAQGKEAAESLLDAVRILDALATRSPGRRDRALAHGALASAYKQLGMSTDATDAYEAAFRSDPTQEWAAVQRLALLAKGGDEDPAEYLEWWTSAHLIARQNAESPDPQTRVWALNSLVELAVLAQRLPDTHPARTNARQDALAALSRLCKLEDRPIHFVMDLHCLREQLERYTEWWKDDAARRSLPDELAAKLVQPAVV